MHEIVRETFKASSSEAPIEALMKNTSETLGLNGHIASEQTKQSTRREARETRSKNTNNKQRGGWATSTSKQAKKKAMVSAAGKQSTLLFSDEDFTSTLKNQPSKGSSNNN